MSNPRAVFQLVLSRVRRDVLSPVEVQSAVGQKGQKGFRPAVAVPRLEVLLRRAETVVFAASSVSRSSDGWSSMTPLNGNPPGGKGGRRMMSVRDEEGRADLVPTSSTEVSAIAPGSPADPTVAAGRAVNMAVHELDRAMEHLAQALDRWDHLRSTSSVVEPPMCWWAGRLGLPWDPVWEPWRETDFAGLLPESWPEKRRVSSVVYWFVRNHRRLPTQPEMVQALERSVVRVKVGAR